jgi:hypothetical protein
MDEVDTNSGVWILVKGTNNGKYLVMFKIDGVEKTYPESFDLRTAWEMSGMAQKMLELPDEKVLFSVTDIVKNASNSLDEYKFKKFAQRNGIPV